MTEVMVPESQFLGWSHPAVQRVRHELEQKSDGDCHLLGVVEEVLLKGGWMSSFLPFPFTKDSPEGVRLQAVLARAKDRHQNSAVVQKFFWKFWNPENVDELSLTENDRPFEEAFADSMMHTAEEASAWPSR